MNLENPIEFILDASNYDSKNCTAGVDKNDTLYFSGGQHALVVRKTNDESGCIITAYSFKWSKYQLIRFLRFTWIYIKYSMYSLLQMIKLWQKKFIA